MIEFKQKDGKYYRINHETKTVRVVTNKKSEALVYEQVIDEIKTFDKLKKRVFIEKQNEYFRNNEFSWQFEGNWYKTTDDKIKFDKPNPFQTYPQVVAFVFHNGSVWVTGFDGNAYPQVQLIKKDAEGKSQQKWTNIKNCKAFIKLR